MQDNYPIETATSDDYLKIVELLQVTKLPPDGIEPHLANFLIIRHPSRAKREKSLIGSVGLEIYGTSALLRSLAVHPDFQGLGLGTRLVNEIVKLAETRGIIRLFLLTDTAAEYFKRKDFIIVSRDIVPEDMKQSIEFSMLCTSSPSMMLEL